MNDGIDLSFLRLPRESATSSRRRRRRRWQRSVGLVVRAVTNFFSDSNLLGRGWFGPVFKGLMPNGEEMAVKKLSVDSRQGVKEFADEVRLLRKAQHKNLVMLLGCCIEGPERMLVYEYLPNRSLGLSPLW
ncbi:G-type lectin S-receptor-like serine/threonine-protein kinase-like protein [Drosera capensis]